MPIYTLVKLVEAETSTIDKSLTHDFTLEINSITNQFQTQI